MAHVNLFVGVGKLRVDLRNDGDFLPKYRDPFPTAINLWAHLWRMNNEHLFFYFTVEHSEVRCSGLGWLYFLWVLKYFLLEVTKKKNCSELGLLGLTFGFCSLLAQQVSGMTHIMAHVSAANRSAFFSTIGIIIKNGAKLILKAKIIRPLVAFLASPGLIF